MNLDKPVGQGKTRQDEITRRVKRIMKLNQYAIMVVFLGLFSCTWVETTPEGKEVLLVKANNVEACSRVGTASASVKHRVGVFERSIDKVTEELVALGRNKAAEMGGDAIVAKGEPEEGSMSFDVYKCGE